MLIYLNTFKHFNFLFMYKIIIIFSISLQTSSNFIIIFFYPPFIFFINNHSNNLISFSQNPSLIQSCSTLNLFTFISSIIFLFPFLLSFLFILIIHLEIIRVIFIFSQNVNPNLFLIPKSLFYVLYIILTLHIYFFNISNLLLNSFFSISF